MLLTDVSIHLCRRGGRKFSVFCKISAFPAGGVSSLDRFCFLSEMASETVPMQTESA
jgi:hypothetical protein